MTGTLTGERANPGDVRGGGIFRPAARVAALASVQAERHRLHLARRHVEGAPESANEGRAAAEAVARRDIFQAQMAMDGRDKHAHGLTQAPRLDIGGDAALRLEEAVEGGARQVEDPADPRPAPTRPTRASHRYSA
jgi:hypothetical protein